MKRRDALKTAGLAGFAALLPFKKSIAAGNATNKISSELLLPGGCVLIPNETEGPYDFDLSNNSTAYRQDITEGNPGTPLNLTLTLVNLNDNCSPISNARIDIWHCNKDGYYSEFANQPGYLGQQSHLNETFFRGIQMTDANGQVNFQTIYPGWYQGRVTHIHFQVFLSSMLKATSQMAFPDALNTTVYNTADYSAHGQNSVTNTNDGVFSDAANTQYELVTINANTSGGYDASLSVGIHVPLTGIIKLEPETGGQFTLGTNYPNPFSEKTTIPFTLANPAEVMLDLYDLQGNKIRSILNSRLGPGKHDIILDRNSNIKDLAIGNYAYQLTVNNSNGRFVKCKLLSII